MTEYLVRWKFGANSLLNNLEVDTAWYQQFHNDKASAADHYAKLTYNSMPAMKIMVQIFKLTELDHLFTEKDEVVAKKSRNEKILEMADAGHSVKGIADSFGLHYSTVYEILRKKRNNYI